MLLLLLEIRHFSKCVSKKIQNFEGKKNMAKKGRRAKHARDRDAERSSRGSRRAAARSSSARRRGGGLGAQEGALYLISLSQPSLVHKSERGGVCRQQGRFKAAPRCEKLHAHFFKHEHSVCWPAAPNFARILNKAEWKIKSRTPTKRTQAAQQKRRQWTRPRDTEATRACWREWPSRRPTRSSATPRKT